MLIFRPRVADCDNCNTATSCRKWFILNEGCLITRETLKISPSPVLLWAPTCRISIININRKPLWVSDVNWYFPDTDKVLGGCEFKARSLVASSRVCRRRLLRLKYLNFYVLLPGGLVAQLVERRWSDPEVVCTNHIGVKDFSLFSLVSFLGLVVQWIQRIPP